MKHFVMDVEQQLAICKEYLTDSEDEDKEGDAFNAVDEIFKLTVKYASELCEYNSSDILLYLGKNLSTLY